MVVEHRCPFVESAGMPRILELEELEIEMMAELVALCCRQHNATHAARRFMWRSRSGVGR